MIPVSFEYNGKEYSGFFQAVNGAAGQTWFLFINKYYTGTLSIIDSNWTFHTQSRVMEDMADYFGSVVMQWYE